MLGIKIFDDDSKELLHQIFNLINKENLALEVALYGTNIESFTSFSTEHPLYVNNKNKSIHFNYLKYCGNNIREEKYLNNFLIEIEQAKKLLINRGVLHYQHPNNYEIHLEQWKLPNLTSNLKLIHKIAKENDFIFHIENTYIYKSHYFLNDIEHQRLLWDTILNLNLQDHIGLCLDWGHVKAFSNSSLTDWIDYSKFLKSKGMPIYMHVHDNDSKKDLHDSMKESEEKKHFQTNHPKDKPYLEILKDIQSFFNEETLLLEYKSKIAEEHYYWTKSKLHELS